jgi:tRNA-dihydrouridine synthase
MYGGRADWSVIAEVKQSVKIPVWGNGDVTDPASARRMFQETGVDGLMVGRAAQGNPWIFSQLLTELSGNSKVFTEPGLTERIAVITEHLEGLVGSLGEKTAIREMRSQLVFYLRGAKNARKMRSLVMQAKSSHELLAVLADWQL